MNSSKDKYLFNGDENLLKSVECFCVRSAKENFGFASSYSLISGWEVSFLAFHVESWKYFSIETLKLNKFKVLHCISPFTQFLHFPFSPTFSGHSCWRVQNQFLIAFSDTFTRTHKNWTQDVRCFYSAHFVAAFPMHTVSITPQLKYEQYFM